MQDLVRFLRQRAVQESRHDLVRQKNGGIRIQGNLGNARVTVQLDVGFGNVVAPCANVRAAQPRCSPLAYVVSQTLLGRHRQQAGFASRTGKPSLEASGWELHSPATTTTDDLEERRRRSVVPINAGSCERAKTACIRYPQALFGRAP